MSIIITYLNRNDLPELLKWAEDERTMLLWCGPVFDFPLTIEQLKSYFSETQKPGPCRLIFKAVDENGKIAGMCELGAISRRNCSASICRVFVDKASRGKGIADKLISFILEYGFTELELIRIELNVYTFNTPAINCYEKLGFKREGLKRKSTKFENEFWDGYVYAILKEEWDKRAV
ncbi:MAG: GNAT family N-acetyltransferase [Ignavibacteria bacterium]|nr:GNAT family N-acetyltransferase [Ignavibacteria bacterium]